MLVDAVPTGELAASAEAGFCRVQLLPRSFGLGTLIESGFFFGRPMLAVAGGKHRGPNRAVSAHC
jgi:hypothetical protein